MNLSTIPISIRSRWRFCLRSLILFRNIVSRWLFSIMLRLRKEASFFFCSRESFVSDDRLSLLILVQFRLFSVLTQFFRFSLRRSVLFSFSLFLLLLPSDWTLLLLFPQLLLRIFVRFWVLVRILIAFSFILFIWKCWSRSIEECLSTLAPPNTDRKSVV